MPQVRAQRRRGSSPTVNTASLVNEAYLRLVDGNQALEISLGTVQRDWKRAKAWLKEETRNPTR